MSVNSLQNALKQCLTILLGQLEVDDLQELVIARQRLLNNNDPDDFSMEFSLGQHPGILNPLWFDRHFGLQDARMSLSQYLSLVHPVWLQWHVQQLCMAIKVARNFAKSQLQVPAKKSIKSKNNARNLQILLYVPLSFRDGKYVWCRQKLSNLAVDAKGEVHFLSSEFRQLSAYSDFLPQNMRLALNGETNPEQNEGLTDNFLSATKTLLSAVMTKHQLKWLDEYRLLFLDPAKPVEYREVITFLKCKPATYDKCRQRIRNRLEERINGFRCQDAHSLANWMNEIWGKEKVF